MQATKGTHADCHIKAWSTLRSSQGHMRAHFALQMRENISSTPISCAPSCFSCARVRRISTCSMIRENGQPQRPSVGHQ